MRGVDKLYDWLARGPAPDCDRILAAALEHAEPPYFERIVETLAQRGNETSVAGLISAYGRLTPEVRRRLRSNGVAWRSGLAHAVHSPHAETRRAALTALLDEPSPRLAYLLPDALRDSSDAVRKAAGHALRLIAGAVVDELPAADWDAARRADYARGRAGVAQAAYEALRAYDLHLRAEAIEVSLWFARDLSSQLWTILSNRRSQAGALTDVNLTTWNSPRLARFLLDALGVREWRTTARHVLATWSTRAEAVAILRNSDLLRNDDARRWLGMVRDPHWFDELKGAALTELPSELRIQAPRWVCYLGLPPARKVDMLLTWLHAGGEDVQEACFEALAVLSAPEARDRLLALSRLTSPLGALARTCLARQRVGEAPATPVCSAGNATDGDQPPPAAVAGMDDWWVCRDKVLEDDAALIARVRKGLDVWRPHIVDYLRSPDPGERLLGLRIVLGADCGAEFSAELKTLLHDPVDAISRLARRVAGRLPTAAGAGGSTAPEAHP